MLFQLKKYFKSFDWVIFSSVVLLASFGLMEIYSVALGQGTVNLINFHKQIFFIIFGIIILLVFSFIDYRSLKSFSKYLYWLGIIMLALVLVVGSTVNGTKGWFNLFGFGIQPIELIKPILILFLATYLANLSTNVKTLKNFIFSAVSTLLFILLIMLQPDFGSSLVLFGIWLIMILMAGFNKKYFLIIFLAVVALSGVAWATFAPYQRERILTFVNPASQSTDLKAGYNKYQALIAVGSGRLTGKGVGFGSQSQLKFLPEAQTDFIFSVISEETGFLGICLVVVLFAVFFFRVLSQLQRVNNDFGIYFILGALGWIFIQVFVNIGMNIGLVPIVGVPLPFISYGGSAILSLFATVGIIENILIKSKSNY
jgi:rod shape determining protein RodA